MNIDFLLPASSIFSLSSTKQRYLIGHFITHELSFSLDGEAVQFLVQFFFFRAAESASVFARDKRKLSTIVPFSTPAGEFPVIRPLFFEFARHSVELCLE